MHKWSRSHDQYGRHAAVKILFQNQKVNDFETLHEASGKRVLQILHKSCRWDDLDLFNSNVNLVCLCIWMRKISKMSLNGWKLCVSMQIHRTFMFKTFSPHGVVCSCPEAFYMYMYMTIIFKHLVCNRILRQGQLRFPMYLKTQIVSPC